MWICVQCGEETGTQHDECAACGGLLIPLRSQPDTLAGRILDDRYTLLAPVGSGGMGSVYRAKRKSLGAMVAVKVLQAQATGDREATQRFFAEAQFAGQLRHPHNVQVFDFGATDDGLVYLVMDLVDGVPLSGLLGEPMAPERAVRMASQICGALAEAHEQGLIHRDLKPGNVLISQVDGRDFARVLDWGIARLEAGGGLTADSGFVGTPEYLSPEQAAGDAVDRRSDIYNLGLLLFEMLTGRPPFRGNPLSVATKHQSAQPPFPSALVDVDEGLERLVLECLSKDPADRPATALMVRQRLEAWALSGSAPAPPPVRDGVPDPGYRWVLAGLSLGIVALGVVFVVAGPEPESQPEAPAESRQPVVESIVPAEDGSEPLPPADDDQLAVDEPVPEPLANPVPAEEEPEPRGRRTAEPDPPPEPSPVETEEREDPRDAIRTGTRRLLDE